MFKDRFGVGGLFAVLENSWKFFHSVHTPCCTFLENQYKINLLKILRIL